MSNAESTNSDFSPHALSDAWETCDETIASEDELDEQETYMADEEYWEEDAEADAWLAANPGGLPMLYPQLFTVAPSTLKATTPTIDHDKPCLFLGLPSELRAHIYKFYFAHGYMYEDSETEYLKGFSTPDADFGDRYDLTLTTENGPLKFWLSRGLLQTSRQLRAEGHAVFFATRAFRTESLTAIPRLAEFLGEAGRAMVQCIDFCDILNTQEKYSIQYRRVLSSLQCFPQLDQLRIVLTRNGRSRCRHWLKEPTLELDPYDSDSYDADTGELVDTSEWEMVPKLRMDYERDEMWPELGELSRIRVNDFIHAVEDEFGCYREFSNERGLLPNLSQAMRTGDPSSLIAAVERYIKEAMVQEKETAATKRKEQQAAGASKGQESGRSSAAPKRKQWTRWPEPEKPASLTASLARGLMGVAWASANDRMYDTAVISAAPAWQETDGLLDKTIPLYNLLRQHIEKAAKGIRANDPVRPFLNFPSASVSTGVIIRDCAICYVSSKHCGYHNEPTEHSSKESARRYKDLSFDEIRNIAHLAVGRITRDIKFSTLQRAFAMYDYAGWPCQSAPEWLHTTQKVVDLGEAGETTDKEEVRVWDVVYWEIWTRYADKTNGQSWVNDR